MLIFELFARGFVWLILSDQCASMAMLEISTSSESKADLEGKIVIGQGEMFELGKSDGKKVNGRVIV